MEYFEKILPAVIGVIGVIAGALISMAMNKKSIKTDTITKNRIEWIKDVRSLVMDFIIEYSDSQRVDNKKMRLIRNNISLYLRANVPSYRAMNMALNKCVDHNEYDEKLCDELIDAAQVVFAEVFVRAKREAGISKREDKRFEKEFNEMKNNKQ